MGWGDFLIQKLKRELLYLGNHVPKILTSAFLCSIGGILLWVNGTNLWYVLYSRTSEVTISILWTFFLCLLTYALCGANLAFLLTVGISLCSSNKHTGDIFIAFALQSAIYLLLLTWYVIFFCTHLSAFALILLLLIFVFTVVVFLLVRHWFLTLKFLLVLLAGIELYFLIVNFRFL